MAPPETSQVAPGITVAAVARRLGVAPATLRTWDRRYGLGPSRHAAGAHRRYTDSDVARLEVMRRLTLRGVTPADAARGALSQDEGTSLNHPQSAASSESAPSRHLEELTTSTGAADAARALHRAATALDSGSCTALLRASLDDLGVRQTWLDLLVPVLTALGDRCATSGAGVEVEHLLSECVMACFRSRRERVRAATTEAPILLAAADEEQHTLALHALAAALTETSVTSRLLGARVPPGAVAAAVRRCGPAAVLIWSQTSDTADPTQLQAVPSIRPKPLVVAAGPGWATTTVPPVARVVSDFDEAVSLLRWAVGRSERSPT